MDVGRSDPFVIAATLNVASIPFHGIGRMDNTKQVVAMPTGSFTMHMTDLPGRATVAVLKLLHTNATDIPASGGLVGLLSAALWTEAI